MIELSKLCPACAGLGSLISPEDDGARIYCPACAGTGKALRSCACGVEYHQEDDAHTHCVDCLCVDCGLPALVSESLSKESLCVACYRARWLAKPKHAPAKDVASAQHGAN